MLFHFTVCWYYSSTSLDYSTQQIKTLESNPELISKWYITQSRGISLSHTQTPSVFTHTTNTTPRIFHLVWSDLGQTGARRGAQMKTREESLRAQALHVAQAGGVAVVVGDDDGGVQRLKIQNYHRVAVETGFWLHDQGNALGGPLLGPLLHAGGHCNVVEGLDDSEHHGLHPVLGGGGLRG